jgi:hypothetical protein
MAKKLISKYVFEPGISKDDNLFPKAYALLSANKNFILTEMVAFINYRIANDIEPYTSSYIYESSKCIRDIGYVIDAVLHDLRYGGNVEIRAVSRYFWIDGINQLRPEHIEGEITALNFVRDLINGFVFNNTAPSTLYQTSVPQVIIAGQNAEAGASSRITAEMAIISNVIEDGLEALPAKSTGVSRIKILEKYVANEILLCTDTESGTILYSFADPANSISISYKSGVISGNGTPLPDLDFPAWWQTTDAITSVSFSTDTSSLTDLSAIQLFVEEEEQTIRPWLFGTDAIERMRVAAPQAMLDADFEYGLQPTKWQAIALQRSYPSLYEIPGTDATVTACTTDASSSTGNFGSSLISVTTQGNHSYSVGTPITIRGLNTAIQGFSRAEGSFLVHSIPSPTRFTYYASSKVGTANGQSLFTSFISLRQAGFYTGAEIGSPTFSVFSNGSSATVLTKFITPEGSTSIAFDGDAPSVGAPISGTPLIPAGTQIGGVVGAATVNASVAEDTTSSQTYIDLVDGTGIQQGMAIDNGSGTALFITSIAANRIQLNGPIGVEYSGANAVIYGVSGTNDSSIGSGATFDVDRSSVTYTVSSSEDSSANGENYQIGDLVRIDGGDVGGVTGVNDIDIVVTQVDSGGAITNFSYSGLGITGGAEYTNVTQSSSTGSGINATVDVVREGGSGIYTIALNSGGGNHTPGDEITWLGSLFDGEDGVNDIVIRVDGVSFPAQAVVDYTVISVSSGASGDESFTGVSAANITPTGSGATFDIQRNGGVYSVTVDEPGSGYTEFARILIAGDDLGGTDPLNNAIIVATNIDGSGGITNATIDGSAYLGGSVDVYPAMTISEAIEGDDLPDGTQLDVGAIATIEVNFSSNHGLVPGAAILTNITSQPAPDISSEATELPSSGTWTSIAFANDVFVAVRSGSNASAYSIDGTNWSAGGNLPSSASWTSIAAGLIGEDYYFVAVASGGTAAAYSTNGGQTWTASTLPSSGTWTSVCYYDERFVAVRSGSTASAYSTNGTTWTAGTISATANWSDVAGGTIGALSYFVTIATGSTSNAYSIDGGASWTNGAALPANTTWSAITYGFSRFVAVATGGTSAAYSTNGTSWTASVLPVSTTWNDITFGDDNFLAVSQTTNAATSFDGITWTPRTLSASATYDGVAFGDYSGLGVFAAVATGGTSAIQISLSSANHSLAAGPFIVTEVPTLTSLRYPAKTTGTINSTSSITGSVYSRPDAFFVHRPFDGGVQLGTGGPSHGAQAIRQSKKYIRYQSGKGIMYTTGALFAPSYNLASATANGIEPNSVITFVTDDTDHGLQAGGIIEITGMATPEYNGIFTVESIKDSRTFRVRSNLNLGVTTGVLGIDAKIAVKNWHGATVRTGPFDEQNGIFLQYDGRYMALVRRSSTFQIAGSVSVNANSNLVTGAGTRFQDQLKVGDRVVLRGMTHTVTAITSQTSMTFNPDFRGNSNIVGGKMCLTQDLIIPQSDWNLDQCDGNGPSGFNLEPTKMQMVGVQYSWYAAGFIEWLLRGSDGKFVFLHRLKNSNINTEAYMRTANLPVRYEVENVSARSYLRSAITSGQTTMTLADGYYFPTSGVVYIDNELISFTGKNGDTLTGLTRGATYSNFAAGVNRTYSAGANAAHAAGAGVILISCTITPQISHWGSALLTDGMFDEDRGYLFSYASTGLQVSTTKNTAFLIRLAPSVSNAIIGDLGERDLLNRAQLLLDEISITADSVTGGGGIVIEGILNPQNYPTNPSNISWGGLSGLSQGGQPSFAQIAPGSTVDWASGASQTTKTAQTATSTTLNRRNFLYFKQASWEASGTTVGTEVQDPTKFPAGTRVSQIFGPANYRGGSAGLEYLVYFNQSSIASIPGDTNITFVFGQPPYALPGETVFSFIANPGERASLNLTDLKELTTTVLGGRGAFPNGPDVLAINVYKVAGTTTSANIILRWSEAQA